MKNVKPSCLTSMFVTIPSVYAGRLLVREWREWGGVGETAATAAAAAAGRAHMTTDMAHVTTSGAGKRDDERWMYRWQWTPPIHVTTSGTDSACGGDDRIFESCFISTHQYLINVFATPVVSIIMILLLQHCDCRWHKNLI